MVGRWYVTEEDMKVFGMVRHKMQMAVFFSIIDVSKDLQWRTPCENGSAYGL